MRDISDEVINYHSGRSKSEVAQSVYNSYVKGIRTSDKAFEAFHRKPYYISEESKNGNTNFKIPCRKRKIDD